MDRVSGQTVSQFAALIGGFITLLYTFYYVQQLAYSIGIYSGISRTIVSYNITNKSASALLVGALSQSTTLTLALHLTYALLPFAVLILAIGVLWLFAKTNLRLTATLMVISAIIYLILAAILEFDFSFKGAPIHIPDNISWRGAGACRRLIHPVECLLQNPINQKVDTADSIA